MKAFAMAAAVVVVVVIAFVMWIGSPKGPPLDEVAHLKQPRITTMPSQKVLQVTAEGSPSVAAKNAFGLLMKTYFGLKGVPKGGPDFKAPRARWPLAFDTPVDQWVGHFAMPVPQSVTETPGGGEKEALKVVLVVWEYGEVAEMLHVGRYSEEEPTITALNSFIEQSGYEICGEHEEEYLKGPGMIFAGNPDKYLTIIRYQVRKKEPSEETATPEAQGSAGS